jgi:hypothetical protein
MTNKPTQDIYKDFCDKIVPIIGTEMFMAEAKKADAWITELTDLVIAANIWGEENNYPIIDEYPQYLRARTIGEEVVRWGGRMKVMQTIYKSVRKRLDQKGLNQCDLALLVFGWSGISGWEP